MRYLLSSFNVSVLYLFKPISVTKVPKRIWRKITMAINFSSAQFNLSSSLPRAFFRFHHNCISQKYLILPQFERTFTFLPDHYIATFIYFQEESWQWLSVWLNWDSHQWLRIINAIAVILSNVIRRFAITSLYKSTFHYITSTIAVMFRNIIKRLTLSHHWRFHLHSTQSLRAFAEKGCDRMIK